MSDVLYTLGYTVLYVASAVFGAKLGFAVLRLMGVRSDS